MDTLYYAEQVSDGSESALTKESWSDLFTLLDANRRELFTDEHTEY